MSPENANPRAELEARLRFETLLAELSSKFVNLPAGEVDREIMGALRRVCELLDLDLLVFWQPSGEAPDTFCVTHFYYAPQDPASPEHFKEENYPWFKQELMSGRIASFASLEQLPAEAARDRESFRQAGTKSNLSLPLLVGGGSLIGAFCLNALRTERDWPDALVKRLQLVAQIFANALARKRADQERRESEERMALAAEAAEFGVWRWNIAHNQIWGTERWLRLFGFVSGEDISFEKVIQRIHPDNRALVEWEVRHASVNGRNYAGEFRVVLPDGTERWIASRGRVYKDASGKPTRMLGAATDITERKRTEEALRTSERRLEVSADLAGLGCYEVNYFERCSFADERFGAICGVPAGYEKGVQRVEFWLEHIHADDRPRVLEARQKLHEGKVERYDLEYRYLHPVEGQKWLHHVGRVATRDAAGHWIRAFGVVRDITERKRAETELQRLRLQLWHTDRVAQTGAITASLAHELNQPLTAILSNAQAGLRFMDSGKLDLEEMRAILTDNVHDDKRAGAVISGLRNMLRRKETQRERINLADAVDEVLVLVHSELVEQQVELRQRLAPATLVMADKGQLQQVILNLVMNAVQAMQNQPADERRLELMLTQTETGEARLAVCDSGPGIPEEQQGKLFEAFWTTKNQGLGIGLHISRSIIESHGGRLSFANRPDRGATFSITLPLATKAGDSRPHASSAADPGAP
jgi:PAS domain S-box-containing protein